MESQASPHHRKTSHMNKSCSTGVSASTYIELLDYELEICAA